jgi:hypothetical protein
MGHAQVWDNLAQATGNKRSGVQEWQGWQGWRMGRMGVVVMASHTWASGVTAIRRFKSQENHQKILSVVRVVALAEFFRNSL